MEMKTMRSSGRKKRNESPSSENLSASSSVVGCGLVFGRKLVQHRECLVHLRRHSIGRLEEFDEVLIVHLE